jgi:hypothetical protein
MSDKENENEKISASEIRDAIEALRSDPEPSLSDVLTLVAAGLDDEKLYVPEAVQKAVVAKWQTDRDFANGGMDQFVWNHGVEEARWVAGSFRAVGAIENADLIDRLATELESFLKEVSQEEVSADSVRRFLDYRKRVEGPYFDCPDPGDEVGEALTEYLIAHHSELAE